MVIVLDDLQWADVASLGLLEFIAPRLVDASVLLVGTYRDNELGTGHPLAATLGALARLPRVVRLFPRPLSSAHVAVYLRAVSDSPPGGEVVDAIWSRTGGNPFFMTELVKLLVSEDDLDRPAADGGPVPAGVGDVIRRLLSRLRKQTNMALSVAAVIGQDFDLAILATASRLDRMALEEALEWAAAAGIVAEIPGHADRYGFSHDLIRETVYRGISNLRRTRLHARVAEALEESSGEEAAALAYHCCEAIAIVGVERAVAATVRAAGRAQAATAFEAAEDLLRRAIELLNGGDRRRGGLEGRDRLELRVQTKLTGLLTMTRGYADADVQAAATRTLELCRTAGRGDNESLAALYGLASFHVMTGDIDSSGVVAQMMFDAAKTAQSVTFNVGAHLMAGITEMHRGRQGLAEHHLEIAVEAADRLPSREARRAETYHQDPSVSTRAYLAITVALRGDEPRAAQLMSQALDRAYATGHPFHEVFARFFSAWLAVYTRDPIAAEQHATMARELADRSGFVLFGATARVLQGWAQAHQGGEGPAVELIEDGLRRSQAIGAKMVRRLSMALLGEAQLAAGRRQDALDTIRRALAENETATEGIYQAEQEFRRAEALAREQGSVLFQRRAENSLAAHARRSKIA